MTIDVASPAANSSIPTPTKECDVIMKGGITSGVVFPLAIYELSKQYRFVNLGGTSAGGIAAAVAAAAEYNRAGGGFERIKEIPHDLGENLLKLFQPSPKVRPLFDAFIALSQSKRRTADRMKAEAKQKAAPNPNAQEPVAKPSLLTQIRWYLDALLAGYRTQLLTGASVGAVIFFIALFKLNWGWMAFGLLFALVGAVFCVGRSVTQTVLQDIPKNNFGFCTGATQQGYDYRGVTEWLADTIDECAGLKAKGRPGGIPLTFGDVAGKKITLEMMTTNLSMKRPYRLPFREQTYLYRKSEIGTFFPKRVAEYMLSVSDPLMVDGKPVGDYFHVPAADKLPVIFAVRLSLSFPVLFTAIPLYARDFTLMGDQDAKPRRCLFSDGGISNNFPIQFFDQLWPNAPTFGISLDEYNKERDRKNSRIYMPQGTATGRATTGGALLPIDDISGLPAFIMSIIYSAKDWQDNLQSTQHGYRERIVHVALTPDEGGLNLDMPKATIDQLTKYGAQAGATLNQSFDLDEHRWRRFLTSMARVEATLFDLQEAYNGAVPGADSFGTFLSRYPEVAKAYKASSPEWLAEMRRRADALVAMAKDWRNGPQVHGSRIPQPESDLRITPKP